MLARICVVVAGLAAIALAFPALSLVGAQVQTPVDAGSFLRELSWRNIGPFRGGRTSAASGVPSQPNVFYIGAGGGGLWKTTDAGRSWQPTFDGQPVGSIGAVAIATSNPDVIYVGTGAEPAGPDASTGTGVYRSTDAGQTWTHLGLPDSGQIASIVVDPADPNRILVAALGRPFGPNTERGVFRSTNGGRTFERVLYKDADTGAVELALDPSAPAVGYAALWQSRWNPWTERPTDGPGSGLLKSTDGGATWRPIGAGLPSFTDDGLGRMTVAVAPSNTRRVYTFVKARTRGGLYVSNDAGETFTLATMGPDVTTGALPTAIAVDPQNADVVYVAGAALWRSIDAGRTFAPWRQDPSGARYERLWMNPLNPRFMLVAGDRGAIVTVNGGVSWSSTENQPTGRFGQIMADTGFPYRICGSERTGVPGCLASRGDGGITQADWRPVGTARDGFVAPDPSDAEVIYSGALVRYDRRTSQIQNVAPPLMARDRVGLRQPVVFAPTDTRTLFFGTTVVWKTTTSGQTWTAVSPDLSRDSDRPGSISALAPSPVDARAVWAGTEDGALHVTRDGGLTWNNVTPPDVVPWARIASIEASRFDANTAYAAVDMQRLDDAHAHLWRTRDGGTTWLDISGGLASAGVAFVVREDPFRRGLLFAATDRSVFVSFDDGNTWASLRLNLPPAPVRDLIIKDADLIAATDGRGFWVLDDISPLRQITGDIARADAFLFRPAIAWRVRPAAGTIALTAGEPAAQNAAEGAIFHYLVGPNLNGLLTLEVIETATGEVIRRFSSTPSDGVRAEDAVLKTTPGLHRIVWDLRYTPTNGRGVLVLPSTYQVRLTVAGRPLRQAVVVRMDPRVRTATPDLIAQFKLAKAVDEKRREVAATRDRLRQSAGAPLTALDAAMDDLTTVFDAIQQSDLRPTPTTEAAANTAIERAAAALAIR